MLQADHRAFQQIATPALVVDGAALHANIDAMAATARHGRIALRPHAKTHKSDRIARLQLAAGAVGVGCATLTEAEALAGAGLGGLLLTTPVMGETSFARLARIHRQRPLTVVVDHPAQVEGLAVAAGQAGAVPIQVLVDVDVGQHRTGVGGPAEAVALARRIAASPGLSFAGLQGYAGHVQHISGAADRRAAAAEAGRQLAACAAAVADVALPARIVSGSGTGSHLFDIGGPYTELQPGSYVFMDADYARVLDDQGAGPRFAPSLFVLATVVSANRTGRVTVDAGTKALAVNGPLPCVIRGVPAGTTYAFAGDEHGILDLGAGPPPGIGARVLIGATHCDPTVNLHPCLHVIEGSSIEAWPVVGRYGAGT